MRSLICDVRDKREGGGERGEGGGRGREARGGWAGGWGGGLQEQVSNWIFTSCQPQTDSLRRVVVVEAK